MSPVHRPGTVRPAQPPTAHREGEAPAEPQTSGQDALTGSAGASPSPVSSSPSGGIGTVRYPRLVAADEEAATKLKKRTLTNLYNERPTWLDLAHRKLDEAVFAAYGWDPNLSDDDLLEKLLDLNLKQAAEEGKSS